ncbi:hypothetical protein OHA72_03675 [Dactylosporangium sp. NBC_01737]|uniref:DUF2231 domain-containing protein n=1 Tax=Dactylosporangium sp. NBC_01737 TaxID=2975959 RepID=UPI002E14C24D|nr:hypothetical protein OHA72_03675 [Dactylosporangium sp. NBC_01737]
MFERVLGLPAHPLFIHAAVVLVPLLAIAGILYAVWPGARRHVRWTMIVLAVATPGAVFAAKESGEAFETSDNFQSAELQAKIEEHEGFGSDLFLIVLGLALVALVMAYLVRPLAGESVGPVAAHWALAGLTVLLGLAAFYYVFKTGDSGAHMVWDGF